MSNQEILQTLRQNCAYINRCVVRAETKHHAHNFVELAYVADGNGIHKIGGEEHQTSKGDLWLINYDVAHQFIPQNGDLLIYNCIFTPAYFNATLSESRNFFDITDHYLLNNLYADFPTDYIYADTDPLENSQVFNIYERLLQEFTDRQIGYRDIIRAYILELLVILCRLKLQVDSGRTQKLLDILEYVNTHYQEPLQAEELATSVGFSPSHFRRIFKELTGKTPNLYLQTVRIEKACALLKNDHSMSVEQIARSVGYHDIKHFYYVFKKITGSLPKRYR